MAVTAHLIVHRDRVIPRGKIISMSLVTIECTVTVTCRS